jgi:hypothetical protein
LVARVVVEKHRDVGYGASDSILLNAANFVMCDLSL